MPISQTSTEQDLFDDVLMMQAIKSLDWSKFPKLRAIFEHRPLQNVYWRELVQLLADIEKTFIGTLQQ